ncbi:zf-HC2 domain-containing protein [Acidovorax sp. SUPP3334]|uniref:zf-HC2 domain-containing protein n=1 Tax=Acidovorax sp. SUPP3334 TaxID=2920881 RepID=UPI0023DE37AB|nr:zf-HC2 domain-containing protein [Acidovorax sp. SUPP3334]GKT21213.1 zf-HC2 domain-containing protein [Acidovorax sp. SUPP3334]
MPYRLPGSQRQDRSHVLTQETLPWIVNGSASEQQRADVEKHLAQCAECRTELQMQQKVQTAMTLPPVNMPDEQAGLHKLLERIEMGALLDQPLPKPTPVQRRPAGRLTYALATFAVLQAVALAFMGHRLADEEPSTFQTLSTPPAIVRAADAGMPNAIRVVPDGRITLADWKTLLQSLDLQVVSGPNAMGAYAVSTRDAGRANAQALERLRSTPGMQMVEPIGGTP